jgi:hypothetical protein
MNPRSVDTKGEVAVVTATFAFFVPMAISLLLGNPLSDALLGAVPIALGSGIGAYLVFKPTEE